ncbi:MAG: SCP2 sterol-binding domain-containing protein [Gammaproteobacteria bacterium]|jgi:ubiquinone biosynthesis protein UbiJ|nr:SCP2 sterol-binding domain-containing protein [Gammaproteobacteria bacterium]
MTPFTTLAQFALPLIIKVMQHLDEQSLQPLKAHIHKVICFHIEHMAPLYFQIVESGLQVVDEKPHHVDTTFTGPLSAFIAMIFTEKKTHTGLHVRGDLECAKALYDCWHHLDIDWEGQLANVVGDNFAHLMSQGLQTSKKWANQTWQARQDDLSAYLQDESNLLPSKTEVETFFHDVDLLRNDVERFEARLDLLLLQTKNKGK